MKIIIQAAFDTDTGQLYETGEHDAPDAQGVLTGPYTMLVHGAAEPSARHHVENPADLADATLRDIAGLVYLTVGNE